MKRALFYTLILSAAAATAPAFADDSTQATEQATTNTEQAAYTGVTRAEVKAELARARRNGDLQPVNSESYPQLRPYQTVHAEQAASMHTFSSNSGSGSTVTQ